MGSGIAQVAAMAGYRTILYDVDAGMDPAALAGELRQTVGVIDSGIFIGMASEAIVAHSPTLIGRLLPGRPDQEFLSKPELPVLLD